MTTGVIAIDGAAGSGKSTLARALAHRLHLPYLNTGLMYRALTAAALDEGVDLDDENALSELTSRLRFTISSDDPRELHVQGSTPGDELSEPRVDAAVSRASRHPRVRALMREAQRNLGSPSAVVEGRDIGTVVFPDAAVKIFLEADPGERAVRRMGERDIPAADVREALNERDAKDSQVNPLIPAKDAAVIVTTGLTREQVLDEALAMVHRAGLS